MLLRDHTKEIEWQTKWKVHLLNASVKEGEKEREREGEREKEGERERETKKGKWGGVGLGSDNMRMYGKKHFQTEVFFPD